MSKLQTLIDEKNILLNKSDEDYDNELYKDYLISNYSFIPIQLETMNIDSSLLSRSLALNLFIQAIIIYAIHNY